MAVANTPAGSAAADTCISSTGKRWPGSSASPTRRAPPRCSRPRQPARRRLANALQDLPDARRVEVATALDDERLADVLEELPEHDQVEILSALEPERAGRHPRGDGPDGAADLIAELQHRRSSGHREEPTSVKHRC